jgi:predicted DNA-binding protein
MKKKDKCLVIRVTDKQHKRFKDYANRVDLSKSEIIRGFINRMIRKL